MPNTPSHSATSSGSGSLYQVFMEIDNQFFASEYMSRKLAAATYDTLVDTYGDTMNISYHKSKPIATHEATPFDDDDYDAAATLTSMKKSSTLPFSGLHIESYGRGYIIHPKLSHPNYGQKYFHSGFWNPKAMGWFFKEDQIDSLVELGAIYTPTSSSPVGYDHTTTLVDDYDSNEDDDFVDADFTSMVFMKYGKGYLLKPHRTHSDYATKYFHDGFWNAKAKGWFFKRDFKQFLADHGATFLHSTPNTSSR
tara:strand:- start:4759 stop:5514 length:756 start_codon:yes stop_codon:yes gene_type:complete